MNKEYRKSEYYINKIIETINKIFVIRKYLKNTWLSWENKRRQCISLQNAYKNFEDLKECLKGNAYKYKSTTTRGGRWFGKSTKEIAKDKLIEDLNIYKEKLVDNLDQGRLGTVENDTKLIVAKLEEFKENVLDNVKSKMSSICSSTNVDIIYKTPNRSQNYCSI